MANFFRVIFFSLFFTQALSALDNNHFQNELLTEGVSVDLRNPIWEDKTLSTSEGGVITGHDLRIQARNIRYTKRSCEDCLMHTIEAEGDLILEFGDYVFVGSSLTYDFIQQEGILYNGRTAVEPWYFGGEKILLHSDNSITLYSGYVTTSENINADWKITTEEASLTDRCFLSGKNVIFRFMQLPLFWLPKFKVNLDTIFDSPIRYNFKWGGRQGSRVSMIYEFFSWNRFKAFLRVDYRFKRGLGAGLETYYLSEDHKESFETINYWAKDNSVINTHEKHRYRFQGLYSNLFWNDTVSLDMSWDKLSDKDMATDYNDRGLELDTAGKTQALIRKQEERWIGSLFTCLRVNQFQTLKQELPTLETNWKPYSLGSTGIIGDSYFSASYLDFTYAHDLPRVHDYNSPRVEFDQSFYRPFHYNFFQITPQASFLGIYYGNSPEKGDRWLALGNFQVEAKTYLHHYYSNNWKHVIQPYLRYQYITFPTAGPNQHYIFDINDGWYRLDMLRFGAVQEFYLKGYQNLLLRPVRAELYANAFFDTPSIKAAIPKVYADISYNSFSTLRHCFQTAYDCQHTLVDHFNFRTEWTFSKDLAIAGEYRHRSAHDWRKADRTNFILESFRSDNQLFHSQLSDRRDTLLMHLFCRFHPNWALEFEARHGWNRKREPSYNEFEIDFLGTLRSAWNVKISYQRKEEEDRIAFYFSIGMKRPDWKSCRDFVPCAGL